MARLEGLGFPAVAVAFIDGVDVLDAAGELVWSARDAPLHVWAVTTADLVGDGVDDVILGAGRGSGPGHVLAYAGATGELLWQIETPGTDATDMVVWGSGEDAVVLAQVVLGLSDGYVIAYAASDGEELWRHSLDDMPRSMALSGSTLGVGTRQGALHFLDPATGLAAGVPAVFPGASLAHLTPGIDSTVGDTFVVVSRDAAYHVVLVRADVGLGQSSLPGVPVTTWRYTPPQGRLWSATTAQVGDGTARVFINGYNGPQVHALEAATGSPLWLGADGGFRSAIPVSLGKSSVQVMEPEGGRGAVVIAGGIHGFVRAFDAAGGSVVWEAPVPGPVDHLTVLPQDAVARVVYASPHWHVTGLDAGGATTWDLDTSSFRTGTVVDWDGDGVTDAVVATAGNLYVHDGETGELLFEAPVWPHLTQAVTVTVVAADVTGNGQADLVAGVGNESVEGMVIAFDGETGEVLWTFPTPAVAGGAGGGLLLGDATGNGDLDVFVADRIGQSTQVQAIEGVTGQRIWSHTVGDRVLATSITFGDDGVPIVLIGHQAPAVLALRGDTGEVLWEEATERIPWSVPVVERAGTDPAVALVDGAFDEPVLRFLGAMDGRQLASVSLADMGEEFSSVDPVLAVADTNGDGYDDVIVSLMGSGGDDGDGTAVPAKLVAVGGKDKAVLWESPRMSGPTAPVAVGPLREDGGRDVVIYRVGDSSFARMSGEDGSVVWRHPTPGPSEAAFIATAPHGLFLQHAGTLEAVMP